jgi:hypothetical protein
MNDIVKGQEPIDPAEAAFSRMQGELALLRRAIEAMATERAGLEVPDYSATLGQIAAGLRTTAKEVGALADRPALQLTPQALAGQMEAAARAARISDHEALVKATAAMTAATRQIGEWIESARLASLQNRRLIQVGVAGLIAGAILWAALSGVFANGIPPSRGGPERPPTTAAERLDRR